MSNPEDAVILDIDALIDEQLEAGPQGKYYWDSSATFEPCRCGEAWHGLPEYGCPGSDAEGPIHAEFTYPWTFAATYSVVMPGGGSVAVPTITNGVPDVNYFTSGQWVTLGHIDDSLIFREGS